MDTTEKYITMCKTKEIQDRWRPADGDFYVHSYNSDIFYVYMKSSGLKEIVIRSNRDWIWLPRQDQLQDMLSATVTIGYKIVGLGAFYDPERYCGYGDPPCRDCRNMGKRRRITYDTMEQLWLAFVMYEKFDKEWDTEKSEWVKEEE